MGFGGGERVTVLVEWTIENATGTDVEKTADRELLETYALEIRNMRIEEGRCDMVLMGQRIDKQGLLYTAKA